MYIEFMFMKFTDIKMFLGFSLIWGYPDFDAIHLKLQVKVFYSQQLGLINFNRLFSLERENLRNIRNIWEDQ